MALSRPLLVALVAGALLVVSIGADALMNRSYVLEVKDGAGGWHAIATSASEGGVARPVAQPTINVSGAGAVDFRLRETNGYLWPSSTPWEATVNGASFAHGTLSSPPRGEGEVTFSIPTSTWRDAQPKVAGAPPGTFANVEVTAGSAQLYGTFQLEASG
ncbi:MAG: hypothetical protein QOE90_1370 [Thermoplasmata archaeon]|jgi:hypothetical protein|nr:hypothetical protein [Thermoplasmata archaeon]